MATRDDTKSMQSLNPDESGPASGSRPSSRPTSPLCNQLLPSREEVGTALQNTVEELSNVDVDASVLVHLSNCPEALRKLEDLLPIHFYSWKLESTESALIFTLLHVFILLTQYKEVVGERATYQEYVAQLKSRIAQMEEEGAGGSEGSKENEQAELLQLRRENAELRQQNEKLQTSQSELFRINDAWSRDYDSLTKRVDELMSANWNSGAENQVHESTVSSSTYASPLPPSLSHGTALPCTTCHTLQEQCKELNGQMKECTRRCEKLEKLLKEKEQEIARKNLLIERLDNENQAVQMQIQEIGDLQRAVRIKEDYRKLELRMKQKDKQYQDITSQKLQLQQQVEKLRRAFMSIFGAGVIGNSSSSRSRRHIYHHDCRNQMYMSEPIPPPPTPPGLIARGDHMGSLVEKDRNHFDQQVTGFERTTPNLSLPDNHSWPKVAKHAQRPSTLIPQTNGLQNELIGCPTCKKHFHLKEDSGFDSLFDHLSYCGPKI